MSDNITKETVTLGDALPLEMARVRDKLIPVYEGIGPAGMFAVMMMKQDLARASTAIAIQDTVAMLRVYQALKDYKL